MAHFYGTLKGNRGAASRLGTKASDMTTTCQSWEGSVTVCMWHDEAEDRNWVELQTHVGSRSGGQTIFLGPLSDLLTLKDWQGNNG